MEDGVMEDLAYYDRICNGTIYEFDILSNKASLYATGIRGVTGIDYNNEGTAFYMPFFYIAFC